MFIKKASKNEIQVIAEIYSACFPKELAHRDWIEASMNAFPRAVYYTIEDNDKAVGYILWCVKNGFRKQVIVELEQIGIHPDHSGKGFGRVLIEESIKAFKAHIHQLGYQIGSVLVTTSEGNFAEALYKKTLGVNQVATIKGYGSGNELILYNQQISTH